MITRNQWRRLTKSDLIPVMHEIKSNAAPELIKFFRDWVNSPAMHDDTEIRLYKSAKREISNFHKLTENEEIALKLMELPSINGTFFRGESYSPTGLDARMLAKIGDEFEFKHNLSVSTDPGIASEFSMCKNSPHIWVLRGNAIPVIYDEFEQLEFERELIVPMTTRFRIVEIHDKVDVLPVWKTKLVLPHRVIFMDQIL